MKIRRNFQHQKEVIDRYFDYLSFIYQILPFTNIVIEKLKQQLLFERYNNLKKRSII